MAGDAKPLSPTLWDHRRAIGYFLLLLAALHLATASRVRLSEWSVGPGVNTNYAEALAWRSGRMDIPERIHDSARVGNKFYSVNPPLFSFIACLASWLQAAQEWPDEFLYRAWYVMVVALPPPILGYWLMLRTTGDPPKAALLTFAWIVGTPVIAALATARGGGINSINHLLSQSGLLIMLLGIAGARGRIGLSLFGLAIAVWSRPTTLPFLIPILIKTWRAGPPRRRLRLGAIAVVAGLILAPLLTLNYLKFGSPFDTGYRYVYEGRIDDMAQRGRTGTFSAAFIPRNAWFMNVAYPRWRIDAGGLRALPNSYGASIWLTMPLLVYVIGTCRQWWADPVRRSLMIASLIIIAGLLCYHNTGYVQPGYYRYAMDFLPVWFFVIAPFVWGSHRTPLTLAAIAYSCVYFSLME